MEWNKYCTWASDDDEAGCSFIGVHLGCELTGVDTASCLLLQHFNRTHDPPKQDFNGKISKIIGRRLCPLTVPNISGDIMSHSFVIFLHSAPPCSFPTTRTLRSSVCVSMSASPHNNNTTGSHR